jgi:alcohol dehydrogenase (cytochrome c)
LGVFSTSGNLVFGGTNEGNFFALDCDDRQRSMALPGGGDKIIANPISFGVNGRQYVAIAAGDLLLTFALPQ